MVMENPNENPDRSEATNCFMQARTALKNGEINTAEKLLRRALKLWPDNYNYTLQLAKLAIQVNKAEPEIEELLQKSSVLNISATEPRLLLATQYEKFGQGSRAVSIYKGVLNIDPSNLIVRRKLGQLNIDLGQSMSMNTLETRALTEILPEESEPEPPPRQSQSREPVSFESTSQTSRAPQTSQPSQPPQPMPLPAFSFAPIEPANTNPTSPTSNPIYQTPIQNPVEPPPPSFSAPIAKTQPTQAVEPPHQQPVDVEVDLTGDESRTIDERMLDTDQGVTQALDSSENSWESLMEAIQHDSQMFEIDGTLPLNVGISYMEMGLYTEAAEEFQEAWKLFVKKGDDHALRCCQLLVEAFMSLNQYEEAIEWCTQGLAMCERTSEDGRTLLHHLATIYTNQGKQQLAAELREELGSSAIDEREFGSQPAEASERVAVTKGQSLVLRPVRGMDSPADIKIDTRQVEIIIGRGGKNDINIDSQRVSKQHALLRVTDAGLALVSLSKTNGTYLNGEKLENEVEYLLQIGDLIGLGKTIDLKLEAGR